MKYPTKYRYVVWQPRAISLAGEVYWCNASKTWKWNDDLPVAQREWNHEPQLGEFDPAVYGGAMYDMEDEEDRLLIEALMTL